MITLDNFQDKIQTQKGQIGENIIKSFLKNKGYIIYKPELSGAHAFDILAIRNKQELLIAEVKSKARRNKYPDTGIDIKHYNEYKYISQKHNLPIFIFFVDEMEHNIYGNFLSLLEKPTIIDKINKKYPSQENSIIYFPLKNMKTIFKLTDDQVSQLKKYSTRNYKYLNDP